MINGKVKSILKQSGIVDKNVLEDTHYEGRELLDYLTQKGLIDEPCIAGIEDAVSDLSSTDNIRIMRGIQKLIKAQKCSLVIRSKRLISKAAAV